MPAGLRAVGLSLVLLLPAFAPAAVGSASVCAAAATGSPHAALVVDTGARVSTYCVALDGGSVSGIRLIELASEQHGLGYRLGFGGQAVCQLEGVGPTGSDCFADFPDFWGYWHGTSGGWTWASSGAGSATVEDGDVEGWWWGSGDSGTTHPAPPATSIDDVCVADEDPATPPGDDGGGGDGGGGGSGGSDGGPGDPGDGGTPSAKPSGGGGGGPQGEHQGSGDHPDDEDPGVTPTATASTDESEDGSTLAAAPVTDGGGGPPAGGLLAVGAIAVLSGAGAVLLRRRSAGGG